VIGIGVGAWLLTFGVVLAAPAAYGYASELLRVDSCLDAGGAFDYVRARCDHESAHPYVAFVDRHRWMAGCGGLGLALVAAGLVASWNVRPT